MNTHKTLDEYLLRDRLDDFDFTADIRKGLFAKGATFNDVSWIETEEVVNVAIKPLRDEIKRLREKLAIPAAQPAPLMTTETIQTIYTLISHAEGKCSGCLNVTYEAGDDQIKIFCNQCGAIPATTLEVISGAKVVKVDAEALKNYAGKKLKDVSGFDDTNPAPAITDEEKGNQ